MEFAIHRSCEKPLLVRIAGPLLMLHVFGTLLFLAASMGSGSHLELAGLDLKYLAGRVLPSIMFALTGLQFWAGTELVVEGERGRRLTMAWVAAASVGTIAGVVLTREANGAPFRVLASSAVGLSCVYLYLYRYQPAARYFSTVEQRSTVAPSDVAG